MDMGKNRKPNRLIHEKSPYLLQHAYNPVDWYPWGEEAFEKARIENRPVFLSVGYSTCHWCHVMERESFEGQDVAAILNDSFISIKVDREERPDVDHIYMEVCQSLTGSGGWPLTVIMTPDKKPFFAGTYFPKRNKWGRPGLIDILITVSRQWDENPEQLIEYGNAIVESIEAQMLAISPDNTLSETELDRAYAGFEKYFDGQFGGFSSPPKFPTPHNLLFLLHYWRRTGREHALTMVERTLSGMRQGGIYDHLGFGFCRYSTDNKWLVPHFEKMLYDNALLCYAYMEAYQATGNREYAQVSEEIIEYVLRDMTSSEGAFYSAEDADSEGVEGLFYLWTKDEIIDALGWEQGCIFADYYHVTAEGNFEQGKSILHAIGRNVEEYAAKLRMDVEVFRQLLNDGRKVLYQLREKRIRPFRDDKILTAWNALMIAALAKTAKLLGRQDYLRSARETLTFIETRLTRDDGRLLARYRDGEAAFLAYLDDYAFLLWALIELYEASFDSTFLQKAKLLADDMIKLFADTERGGFFFTGIDGEGLLMRPKEIYDGAMPSGNSVAVFVLLKLARLTSEEKWQRQVDAAFQSFATIVKEMPKAYAFFLLALHLQLEPLRQIVISGSMTDPHTKSMLQSAVKRYMPEVSLILNNESDFNAAGTVFARLGGKESVNGRAAAYICDETACHPPIIELERLNQVLQDLSSKKI